jgi:hypothetical protein
MKPIIDPRIVDSAWESFAKIFDTTWTQSHPRAIPKAAPTVAERFLYPQSYRLDGATFEAVRKAAEAYGESHYILNMTEYDPEKPQLWTGEWAEGPEFVRPRELALLENAIYSPTGRWGVWLTMTSIAVLAGDEGFVRSVEQGLPRSFDEQLEEAIEDAVDFDGRPADFLPEFLSRFYAPDHVQRKIDAIRLSRLAKED